MDFTYVFKTTRNHNFASILSGSLSQPSQSNFLKNPTGSLFFLYSLHRFIARFKHVALCAAFTRGNHDLACNCDTGLVVRASADAHEKVEVK